jgi:ubiquitin-like modifier-activating enzyme ATG7
LDDQNDDSNNEQQRQAEAPSSPPPPPPDEAAVTPHHPLRRHRVRGTLVLSNSLDEFKSLNRSERMRTLARDLWRDVLSGRAERDPARLAPFLLLAHADLKRYVFFYQFAFPALRPPTPFMVLQPGPKGVTEALGEERGKAALQACDAWRRGEGEGDDAAPPAPFWLVRLSEGEGQAATCHPLSAWSDLTRDDDPSSAHDLLVAMADPCQLPLVPGWPLRNLLLLASARWAPAADASTTTTNALLRLRVLCVRDGSSTGRASAAPGRSFVVDVTVPPLPDGWKGAGDAAAAAAAAADPAADLDAPDALGWEPDASGRPLPRELDLSPHLSPLALAEQAVALNLRLMRWRAAPALELARVARCRCLLLGAGTLGCALARTLLAWGVRGITFVDSGRVAYSNPVRQSLFEHSDCLEGGKPKAAAAAEALARIFPGVDASGVEMRIPMPGHPDTATGGGDGTTTAGLEADALRLDALVEQHDAVFLLTDTRESRWLPALLAAARRKVAITAALGFDGYLVMRHGVEPLSGGGEGGGDGDNGGQADDAGDERGRRSPLRRRTGPLRRVGCYFCQDVVAPADSTRRRALDQQCTVARPGLAPIAGALAAELLAALLQHPQGVDAPAAAAGASSEEEDDEAEGEERAAAPNKPALGPVPHMIRGQLDGFTQTVMSGRAFEQCTACGPAVVRAWRERGAALVREAAVDPSVLERIAGLDALREEMERRMSVVSERGGGGAGLGGAAKEGIEVEGGGEGGGGGGGGEDDDDWVDL